MLSLFEKLTLTAGALDHVVVRDDVAGLVDHEAGAERCAAPRPMRGKSCRTDRLGCDDGVVARDLDDARRAAR